MSQQFIDTTGISDTLQSGMNKVNSNFTELYSSLTGKQNISSLGADVISTIHSATLKTGLADSDEIGSADSAAGYGLKKSTFGNLKSGLKNYFDGYYNNYTLPAPTTSGLGGVMRNVGSAGQFVTGINISGELIYGTPAGGGGGSTLVRGDATLQGNTDAGSAEIPASPPPILNIYFSSPSHMYGTITVTFDSIPYTIYFQDSDPGGSSTATWIDTSAFSSDTELSSSLSSMIYSLLGPVSSSFSNLTQISNTAPGASHNVSASSSFSDCTSVDGGGAGTDFVAGVDPSGGIAEVEIIPVNGYKTIKPIRCGVHGDSPINAATQFALKVSGLYFSLGADIPASTSYAEVQPYDSWLEWVSGRATSSLVARITGSMPLGGFLSCWAITEQT